MTDVASLGLAVDSSQIKEATLALKALPNAASAAERAAQRWGMATDAAGDSALEFSKRAQAVVRNLEFERAQLTRTTAEQERYAAVRRAGLSAASAQGQAIMASVAALQAQRAATESAAKSTGVMETVTTAAGGAFGSLLRFAGPLALAIGATEVAMKAWNAGMKAADIGEQAEQVNLTTDALQAYRFVAAQNGIEVQQLDVAMTRLTANMGAAQRGGEEQIKMFEKLGVKLLDSKGNLRATADVLPEVSRGLLAVGSNTERNALLTEMMGKSGAKMVTMLEAWAGGNESLIASAKRQGGVLDKDVIEVWDKLKDRMVAAGAASDVTLAKLGAPIVTAGLDAYIRTLGDLNKQLAEANGSFIKFLANALEASRRQGQIGSGPGALKLATPEELDQYNREKLAKEMAANANNPAYQGRMGAVQGDIDRINAAERARLIARQADMADEEARARSVPLSAVGTGSVGVGSPVTKGQGESYQKIIAGAQQYIAMKNIETQALGMNAEAAARLKHEQELLGKATEGGITLGAAQTAQLKGLAAAMAEADDKFKSAKFMDDAVTKSKEFIAAQEIERATLYMSAEAAMAYRLEQEAINRAKTEGIALTPPQLDQLRQIAAAQAASAEQTRKAKEWVDFEKEAFRGFFADVNQGLREGANLWDVFGNAGVNVLNKISDKLMQMAADQLFEAAFPKGGAGGGGGGGFLGGILGFLGIGGGGGANAGGFATVGSGSGITAGVPNFMGMAKGGVFAGGNVIPFAAGGIVNRPTLFPFANGTGLMGEAGPEAIMPLRRGPGGRLGVSMHGNDNRPIVIQVAGDSEFIRVTARDEAVQVVKTAAPGIESRAVNRAKSQVVPTMDDYHRERGGDYRAG